MSKSYELAEDFKGIPIGPFAFNFVKDWLNDKDVSCYTSLGSDGGMVFVKAQDFHILQKLMDAKLLYRI